MTGRTRGKATPNTPRGRIQRRVLLWAYKETFELYAFQRRKGKDWFKDEEAWSERFKNLNQKGARWSAKLFFDEPPTRAQEATVSGALNTLEKNGFVVLYDSAGGLGDKRRTTHIKLTALGRDAALFFVKSEGKSQRELDEAERRSARTILRHIRDLRGKLKDERAYLKRLREKAEWYEWLGEGGTCWDKSIPKEMWVQIANADLHNAAARIEELAAEIEVWKETLLDPEHENFEIALKALLANPTRMIPGLPSHVSNYALEQES